MNTKIRPFNSSGSLLFLTGLLFPLLTLYGNLMLIFNSFSVSSVILVGFGLILTYCVSVDALKTVFRSKIVFYDDYFEITGFDTLADYYSFDIKNFFRPIKPRRIKIKYSEIEQFGLFEGSQLYKRGRDENNRILVTAVYEKKTFDFIIPEQYSAMRKYLLINNMQKNCWMIDVKRYSISQISAVIRELEHYTGREISGGYPSNTKSVIQTMIWGIVSALTVRFGLPRLDSFLNQMHPVTESEVIKSIYVLCGLCFSVISSLGFVILCNDSGDKKKADKKRKAGKAVLMISLLFLVVTIILFIISVNL